MKILTVLAVAGMLCLLAAGTATAVGWTEDWESYTAGTPPTNPPWIMDTTMIGTYTPTSGTVISTRAKSGAQCWQQGLYTETPRKSSRIRRAIGAPVTDLAIVDGWFYNSNGGTTSKRSFVGFQSGFTGNASLVRIGGNNLTTNNVAVQYFTTAVQTVDTGVKLDVTGAWYYMKLTMTNVGGGNWRGDWVANKDGNAPTTGNFTFAWLASTVDSVVVGYNSGTVSEVDWDEISVAVPEPGSILALGTGLVGLVGLIRRRK